VPLWPPSCGAGIRQVRRCRAGRTTATRQRAAKYSGEIRPRVIGCGAQLGPQVRWVMTRRDADAATLRELCKRIRYIRGSVPQRVPRGRYLAYNHVQHTVDARPGENGFRAWTEPKPVRRGWAKCECGWSGLPHYRPKISVRLSKPAEGSIETVQQSMSPEGSRAVEPVQMRNSGLAAFRTSSLADHAR